MDLTYSIYLHLDQLLMLQVPRSDPPEHDEMVFIVVHQAFELWFRLLLHELEKVRRDLSAGKLYDAIATFKRARMVLKTMVAQMDILDTMTPMSFNSFRNRLDTASGFQSVQFRELEFVLGYKRAEMLRFHAEGSPAREQLRRRLQERSLVDCFYDFLGYFRITIPQELRDRDVTLPAIPNTQIEDQLLELYKERPDLEILFELMMDFDEGLQEWRYRHIKLVERTIGNKHGTGGSLGVEFLKKSLFLPVFADLWAIRHRL
jgi:tryptophan 2,3-dioxygenase